MSEYHSFSLAQHLPSNNKIKKDTNRHQGGVQVERQSFHQNPSLISNNASQLPNNVTNAYNNRSINEQQQQLQQEQHHHNNWLMNSDQPNTTTFDILDDVSATNFAHHSRSHTTPAMMDSSTTNNNNDFHPLFDFLPPFNDHFVSSHSNNNMTAHNNHEVIGAAEHVNINQQPQHHNQHAPLFSFEEHPLDGNAGLNQDNEEEERSIIPYFDGIEEPHHYNNTITGNDNSTNGELMPSSHIEHEHQVQQVQQAQSTTKQSLIQTPSPLLNIQHNEFPIEEMNNSTGFLEFQSPTSRINATVSSRMMQGMVNANKMKPAIQAYLHAHNPIEAGERTVIIMTSKVAQKSYGTEKRFLCPPPTAILVGSSWWTPPSQQQKAIQNDAVFRDKDNAIRAPPSLTICISGETSGQQSGRIEWYSLSGTLVGQTGGSSQKLIIPVTAQTTGSTTSTSIISVSASGETKSNSIDDWYRNSKRETLAGGRCVLKRLYINDADEKRKKVECLIKVQLANGLMLGTLSSRGIKVISKPSKKRQSVKNIELCIYHGTTVSLFNRIRSQTVSTKYLGVSSTFGESSVFEYPGRLQNQKTNQSKNHDTCFVARTSTWDPFVIWLVDHSQHITSDDVNSSCRADEYIGCPSLVPTIPYPNPPTIALKNKTNQPLAIRYNQHVVLQCLTTGLVSPVMIVRKVDKASTVVGGARCPDEFDPSFTGGGEYGDEVLGDPVSQLHKIALQIVQHENVLQHHAQQAESHHFQTHYGNPNQSSAFHLGGGNGTRPQQQQDQDANNMMPQMSRGPATYLACLNDLVGTHKTTDKRSPIKGIYSNINPAAAAATAECYNFTASALSATLNTMPTPSINNRKRRVSLMEEQTNYGLLSPSQMQMYNNNLAMNAVSELDGTRRRVSSMDDVQNRFHVPGTSSAHQQNILIQRSHSVSTTSAAYNKPINTATINRKNSIAANSGQALAEFGAYWSEDVTDAAVWTIVGTECARYTFWTPPHLDENKQQQQEKQITAPLSTPFPCLTHFVISNDHYLDPSKRKNKQLTLEGNNEDYDVSTMMTVSGENFTRDLQIWFGDIKARFTEYRSREMLVCRLPPREELMQSVGLNRIHDVSANEDDQDDDHRKSKMPFSIRILLVRGDGVVYKTSRSYSFC